MENQNTVDIVVAVGKLTGKGKVDGGTGWATEGALLRGIPVYVYDQPSNRWYTASSVQTSFDGWTVVDSPPTNVKAIAGIGTRSLSEQGYQEVVAYVESLDKSVVIHSGGASGSDTAFEETHAKRGGKVVSHSFQGQKRTSKAGGVLVHSNEEIQSTRADVEAIAKSLGKSISWDKPRESWDKTIELIARNMYQFEPGRTTQAAVTPMADNEFNMPKQPSWYKDTALSPYTLQPMMTAEEKATRKAILSGEQGPYLQAELLLRDAYNVAEEIVLEYKSDAVVTKDLKMLSEDRHSKAMQFISELIDLVRSDPTPDTLERIASFNWDALREKLPTRTGVISGGQVTEKNDADYILDLKRDLQKITAPQIEAESPISGKSTVVSETAVTPENTKILPAATVAQGTEQGTSKPLAAGSNPAGGATTADGTPLPQPQGERPLSEIVAERLNEFADMRTTAAKASRFTKGKRTAKGRSQDFVSSMMDRSVGAAGVFGESYEAPGKPLAGIDKSKTIQSRLSALFQSIGYTPDGSAGEFLKGKLVPTNDLVAEVMGEMISAIKLLNRPNSPLTPEHRAELGAIVLELSRILHDAGDPRTRVMFEKLTKKPEINGRPSQYFGTVSEGADVFYPGGAEDPFAGKRVDLKGEEVKPSARVRRIAAAEIGQVPSSSMGDEPSVTRSLAEDQSGIYAEVAGIPQAADPVQISRLQKAVDEIGVYGETDTASLNVEIDVRAERDFEGAREALRNTVSSDLAPLLELDGLLSDVRSVSKLTLLDREGGFGAPLAYRSDVPYRSNLFTRAPKRPVEIKIPDANAPESLQQAERERLRAEVKRRLARADVLIKAIDATAGGEYRVQKDAAKRRIQAWTSESIRKLRSGTTIRGTLEIIDAFDTITEMPIGERTVLEEAGFAQENLVSGVKLFNRKSGTHKIVEVRKRVTIKTPDYILAAELDRKAKIQARYDQLVQDFGEDFARAYLASDEGAVIFGDRPAIGETITIEPGSYILPEKAFQVIMGSLPEPGIIVPGSGALSYPEIALVAGIKVAPKYIVLKNGSIVSARSGESGFISHRRVLPFRVREVTGGVFTTGKGDLTQGRRYEIEKLDPNAYEVSDPSVLTDAESRKATIRRLETWYSGQSNEMTGEEAAGRGTPDRLNENAMGTLVTDLEEIIASDAYSALEILAINGDSFPDLEAELLRAIGDVRGEIRLDRIPQYAKTKLASIPATDRGGLRGPVVSVRDAVRVVRPGIPELESKYGVNSVADIVNRETSAQAPTVVDDSTAINSVRRGMTFLFRLAKESAIQLGYGGAKKTRRIVIADVDSAAGYGTASRLGTRVEAAVDQINDAGLLAARAAVEAAKAVLHAGWSEGLDPKYSRTRFETGLEPVGTIRQAPEGQVIPAGSSDVMEAAMRIRRYVPGLEDVGIPLRPTDTDSALYIMRASGALGDKATKFFTRYFEQAGLMDPKKQAASGLFDGITSEDAVQIISEMEAAYRAGGSKLQTADAAPIEFKVLERETPEEATLRVLRDIAAVDQKGREQRAVQAKAAKPASKPTYNITAFDDMDGLTPEGVRIEQQDEYSWTESGDDTGFTPVESDDIPSGERRIFTMNAKKLSKLIAFKLGSLGGISEEGVRATLKQIMLDEEIKGILPTSKKALDTMFIELYKDLSNRLVSQVAPNELVLVKQMLKAAGSEYIGTRLLRVAVNAEPDFEGRPQLDVIVQSDTGKVQKIRVTENGKGLIAAQELLPLLRQTLDAAAATDMETIARPLYEALYESAPLAERPEAIDMPALPKGKYPHGPVGRYVHNVISAIEQGRVPVQEVDLPADLGEEMLSKTLERSKVGQPSKGAAEVDGNDMDAVFEQEYGPEQEYGLAGPEDDNSILMSEAINQGKLATLLRPDQGFGMLSPGAKRLDLRLRTPVGGAAAGAAIDIGMAAAGGYLSPENALLSAGLNATNLLSKNPLKAGLIGSGASLVATAATGGDIGRTIFGVVGSLAGGVLGGAFSGGIGSFAGSVGGSMVADELWKSMFGQQANAPIIKPFKPGIDLPTVRIP